MPITEHLIELRRHLIHGLRRFCVIFGIGGLFVRNLRYFFSPLTALLPVNSSMIATDITSSFLAPIKLTLYWLLSWRCRIFCTKFGRLSHQGYISMKTYRPTRAIVIGDIVLSGDCVCLLCRAQKRAGFFYQILPDNVLPMTDIESYLNFVLKLFLVFGATFEIPVLTLLLVLAGVVTVDSLAQNAVTSLSVVLVLLRLSPHLMAYRWWC